MRGNDRSPERGWSARPSVTLRIAWIALSTAPIASSAGLANVHRPPHGSAGVDAGAARLVGEADEVAVHEAVGQDRQMRPLPVLQVEDRLALIGDERLAVCLGRGAIAVARDRDRRQRIDVAIGQRHVLDRRTRRRSRSAPCRWRAPRGRGPLSATSSRSSASSIVTVRSRADALHLALDEDHALGLGRAVELLGDARRAQLVEHDVDHRLRVGLHDLQRLADRRRAAGRRAVGQVLRIARARALHEGDDVGLERRWTCGGLAPWRASPPSPLR